MQNSNMFVRSASVCSLQSSVSTVIRFHLTLIYKSFRVGYPEKARIPGLLCKSCMHHAFFIQTEIATLLRCKYNFKLAFIHQG